MMRARARHQTVRQIFKRPVVVAILSVAGLLSALIGDGIWDGISWVVRAVPVALYFGFIRRGT